MRKKVARVGLQSQVRAIGTTAKIAMGDAPTPRMSQIGDVPSAACDLVMAANHPTPEQGGPCATCAFRRGTEANSQEHTVQLARLCVEGGRDFLCHEQPQLCRGFIAAINVRGVPQTADERRWWIVAGEAADILTAIITAAKAEQDAHDGD